MNTRAGHGTDIARERQRKGKEKLAGRTRRTKEKTDNEDDDGFIQVPRKNATSLTKAVSTAQALTTTPLKETTGDKVRWSELADDDDNEDEEMKIDSERDTPSPTVRVPPNTTREHYNPETMTMEEIDDEIGKLTDKNRNSTGGSNNHEENDDVTMSDADVSAIDFKRLNANSQTTEWTAINIESVCKVTDDLFPL